MALILLVLKNSFLSSLISNKLKAIGHNITRCHSKEDALKACELIHKTDKHGYQILIVDQSIPEKENYPVCNCDNSKEFIIKIENKFRHIQSIILTNPAASQNVFIHNSDTFSKKNNPGINKVDKGENLLRDLIKEIFKAEQKYLSIRQKSLILWSFPMIPIAAIIFVQDFVRGSSFSGSLISITVIVLFVCYYLIIIDPAKLFSTIVDIHKIEGEWNE